MEMTDFQPFLDCAFSVNIDDGSVLPLQLIAVDALKHRGQPALKTPVPLREQPFRLTFRGPPGVRLPDDTIPMSDPDGRLLLININAYGEDENGIYYDAYFS